MKANLYLTVSAILWGLNFHLANIMLTQVGFIEAGFWRYLFGAATLFILAANNLKSLKLSLSNIKGMFLVGVIGLFGFNIFFFLGLMHTTAINAALIISLNPAITIFLSNRILKTPLEKKHIIGILISLIGVAVLLSKGNLFQLFTIRFSYGDILILIANILFAFHHVWVKKYAANNTNTNFTFATGLFCMVSFLLLLPISGMESIGSHTLSFWVAVIGIGCFGTALAYYTWNEGIKLTGANHAGIFMNVVPLSTAIISVFFNEPLYLYHLFSGLIIISGLLLMKYKALN